MQKTDFNALENKSLKYNSLQMVCKSSTDMKHQYEAEKGFFFFMKPQINPTNNNSLIYNLS